MSTPSGLNHTHNTLVTTNHLVHVSQKQTTDYGTYPIICIASSAWNDLHQRSTIEKLVECKIIKFKKITFQTYVVKCCN